MKTFTDEEIKTFILTQRQELIRHGKFLREVLGLPYTDARIAADWVERYAADYRAVGTELFELLDSRPGESELFKQGMDEIMRHKWILSRNAGRDVGLLCAGRDWLSNHFPGWLRTHT